MSGRVVLEVKKGPIEPARIEFTEHDTIVFGRSKDCHHRLRADGAASRHHFMLEVNPPHARLRDLGSRHGTYVNGRKCGGRAAGEVAGGISRRSPAVDLGNGDEIRVGHSVFRVTIEEPAPRAASVEPRIELLCTRCGASVITAMGGTSRGPYVCPQCRETNVGKLPEPERPEIVPGYEVVHRLGLGGMGAVYLARRQADGNWVALKVMLAQVAVDDAARRRFFRETSIVEQLSHDHIVAFHEKGFEGSAFHFAMEFCPGGSLGDLMARRGGRMPVEEIVPIGLQILEALEYAHDQEVEVVLAGGEKKRVRGVVHRDITPGNILLAGSPRRPTAKLSDFGLAKCFQSAGLSGCTLTGDAGGALPFIPKEQLLDFKTVKPVSDIWSMGATLYRALTGLAPRDIPDGRYPIEVILGGRIVPIRERYADVPRRIADVLDRALADDVADRFQTATEFREALAAAFARSSSATPVASPTSEDRTTRAVPRRITK